MRERNTSKKFNMDDVADLLGIAKNLREHGQEQLMQVLVGIAAKVADQLGHKQQGENLRVLKNDPSILDKMSGAAKNH